MRYGNVELHNAWDIVETEGRPGVRPSRLPLAILPEVNGGVQNGTFVGVCEIRGMLPPGGKARVVLQVESDNINLPLAETFHGCIHGSTTLLRKEPTEVLIEAHQDGEKLEEIHRACGYPFNSSLIRVMLPHLHVCRIISIEGDFIYPEPNATPAKTMLAYGSSITHGAHAILTTGTYAAQTARNLGVDLINLGFGGSAQMEDALARHIVERADWDFATLEMGINVGGWPAEKFRAAVDNFITTIASGHPDKFVFCIDLFTYRDDFVEAPTNGKGFREIVREIAEKQNSGKVIYIDGRTILTDPAGLRLDLVHPGDDGMQEMGRNLAARIRAAQAV